MILGQSRLTIFVPDISISAPVQSALIILSTAVCTSFYGTEHSRFLHPSEVSLL